MITLARETSAEQLETSDIPLQQSRVLIVDDHPAVRAGLRQLLEDNADFEVVDAVATAEAATYLAEREPIDVAVVDYQLGGHNGLWASRKLKRLPHPPAVVRETLRGRLDPEEQAIFGMLVAGLEPAEIAETLDLSSAGLESRLWTMLRRVGTPDRR